MKLMKRTQRIVTDIKHQDFHRLNRRAKRTLNQIRRLAGKTLAI